MQNFMRTLAVDGTGGGMAAFGLLNPLLAAFIKVGLVIGLYSQFHELLPKSSKTGFE